MSTTSNDTMHDKELVEDFPILMKEKRDNSIAVYHALKREEAPDGMDERENDTAVEDGILRLYIEDCWEQLGKALKETKVSHAGEETPMDSLVACMKSISYTLKPVMAAMQRKWESEAKQNRRSTKAEAYRAWTRASTLTPSQAIGQNVLSGGAIVASFVHVTPDAFKKTYGQKIDRDALTASIMDPQLENNMVQIALGYSPFVSFMLKGFAKEKDRYPSGYNILLFDPEFLGIKKMEDGSYRLCLRRAHLDFVITELEKKHQAGQIPRKDGFTGCPAHGVKVTASDPDVTPSIDVLRDFSRIMLAKSLEAILPHFT